MLEYHYVNSRSLRSRLLSAFLRATIKPILNGGRYDPVFARSRLDGAMAKRKNAEGVTVSEVRETKVTGEWHRPTQPEGAVILYLHGGGYMLGSARVYRSLTTRLAKLSGAEVFSLDYRLAPEHAFPAPLQDALAAYKWLVEEQHIEPSQLLVAGDSAGGGLTLALLHALKQENCPLPAGAFVYSPWADLKGTGESQWENNCAMFDGRAVPRAAESYLQGQDASSPFASPLYGDYDGFPPLWIYVSDSEAIRDDGIRVAEKADRAGVDVHLHIWKRQPHAWPAFYPLLPEAERCLEETAAVIKQWGNQQLH